MKGCLKFLFLSFLNFFIVGLLVWVFFLGGLDQIKNISKNNFGNFLNFSKEENYNNLVDLSSLSKNYKIKKRLKFMGAQALVIEEKKSNQRFAFIDTGIAFDLKTKDVESGDLQPFIKESISKIKLPVKIQISDYIVVKKGDISVFGGDSPYVNIKASFAGDVNRNLEGMVGIAHDKNKKKLILLSWHLPGKYDNDKACNFFQQIR